MNLQGAEVGNWQRFLNEAGCRDDDNRPLIVDEQWGPRTSQATMEFQRRGSLPFSTGWVDKYTYEAAKLGGFIPFIQAKQCTVLYPNKRMFEMRYIVIHTMEAPEKPGTALAVAKWFSTLTDRKASAHYCIDPWNTIQCVRDTDIAWHAPGANGDGLGIELAGRAGQSVSDWNDEESKAILARATKLVAKLAKKYDIPIVRPTVSGILSKEKGICGHVDISRAFPSKTPQRDHWDPGPNFPWTEFLEGVRGELSM
jgi:hypothetical protein